MNPVNEHGDMIAISAYRKMEADLYDQIYDLQFENAHLRVELEKQAVCNGKGSEREADLLGKVSSSPARPPVRACILPRWQMLCSGKVPGIEAMRRWCVKSAGWHGSTPHGRRRSRES